MTLVAAPTTEPVSLEEAKAHLRIDTTDEDALISALIHTATARAEQFTGRALVTQTWRQTMDGWPGLPDAHARIGSLRARLGGIPTSPHFVNIGRLPLQSVISITTYDDDDNGSIFSSGEYFVDTESLPGRVVLRGGASWPVISRAANGIEIVFIAGYGVAEEVPPPLRQGILMLAGHFHEHREAVGDSSFRDLPTGVTALWSPYRLARI